MTEDSRVGQSMRTGMKAFSLSSTQLVVFREPLLTLGSDPNPPMTYIFLSTALVHILSAASKNGPPRSAAPVVR